MRTLVYLLVTYLTLFPACWAAPVFQEKTENSNVQVELIVEGLGVPWGMAFVSDSELIVTERSGDVGLVSLLTGKVKKVSGVPAVMVGGQGGLLDVAVSSNYKVGDWIYFTYVKEKNSQGVTALARAKITNAKVVQWEDVFVSLSGSDMTRHFGSRIAFDEKGHIFFTVGDRGERPTAQDLKSHNGTVIRLNLDGSIPADNPFNKKKNALPEIWSYGHRNPQGIVYDGKQNRLWVIEHGPRGGDEINLVLPGRNYGWPVISYGKEYWAPKRVGESTHKAGMEQPKKVYTPSIAPGSLILYRGEAFPEWKGSLFAGALKLTHLNRVTVGADAELVSEERLLDEFGERIRALVEGPDGLIYFSTDSGKVLRLKPVNK